MIEAVVLDYGHTIVDFVLSEAGLLAAYEEARGLLAGYLAAEAPTAAWLVDQVAHRIGKRIEASYLRQDLQELDILAEFAQCFSDLGLRVPETLVRQVAYLEHRALSAEIHLWPENADALRALRADGFRLGLVSNITLLGEWVRENLHRLGLLDLFDAVVLSSEEGIRKPHPQIYQTVLDRLGIPGSAAIFVGDRLREDVAGPQAAGMRAVLTLEFRQEEPDPDSATPDAIINRLAELPAAARALRDAAARPPNELGENHG
ncbi:MAG TPA: HAD family hydrolase [Chloroflexota bacterium]|nr:HAD family hydrolase [Chloroflexota bacterium]